MSTICFFCLIKRVKGMEKFLLRALLAGDELHVVQQQQVNHAVLVAECLYVAFLDGGDQLVGEILTLYIYNAVFRWVRRSTFAIAYIRCVLPRPELP